MSDSTTPLDPRKTILVCRVAGKVVGKIPATAPNANAYLTEMALRYKELQVDYEPDPTGGLLAILQSR